MLVVLRRLIKQKSQMAGAELVYKSYESNVIPQIGFIIEDRAFSGGEEVKVIEVSLDYESGHCKVVLDPFEVDDNNNAVQMAINFYKEECWSLTDPTIDL